MSNPNVQQRFARRASVLVLTLIVVALLTLGAMAFFQKMFLEFHAARTVGRKKQAYHFAESGLDYLKYVLSQNHATLLESGGVYSNEAMLKGMLVYDDPNAAFRGRFTFLAPDMTTDGLYQGIRYGALENESTRLNLNALLLADTAQSAVSQLTGGTGTGSSSTGSTGSSSTGSSGTSSSGSSTGSSTSGTQSAGGTTGSSGSGGSKLLMALPGMTEAIADAILDWIDTDDTPRPMGAEAAEYSSAGYPYKPRNGPLQSLDELLLVRDVTPALLYGADLNRDGLIQPMEESLRQIDNVDNSTGLMDRGWSAYLTIDSAERNVRLDGTPKIDVNMENLQELHDVLGAAGFSDEQVKFIIAYRQGGQPTGSGTGSGTGTGTGSSATGGGSTSSRSGSTAQTGSGSTGGGTTGTGTSGTGSTGRTGSTGATGTSSTGSTGTGTAAATTTVATSSLNLDYQTTGRVRFTSILDLIGAKASVVQANQTNAVSVDSPFTTDPSAMQTYLPLLMDNIAVNTQPSIPGRLNINQAPRQLLMGVPGMDQNLLEQIMATRDVTLGGKQQTQAYETWLLTQGVVDLARMKQLLPYVTTGGDVYRARVVGYYDSGGPLVRLEAIVDATVRPPVILRQWEVEELGQDTAAYSGEVLGGQPDNTP